MRIFLGITGASGAPYAKGILDELVAAGADVGVCASSAGIEVLATELYRDTTLTRDDVLARLEGLVDLTPDLGPQEFTRSDTKRRWGWGESKATRELELLVERGVLGTEERYDPRSGRRVKAYWFLEEGEGE